MAYQWRGLYLEDIEIGKEIETAARTITEADVSCFAGLTGDYNPLHTNEVWAKENFFGTRIAHGMLGASIMSGLVNQLGLFEGTTIAFLETSHKFVGPCRIGDTVHVVTVPVEVTPTKKPGRGIVKCQSRLVNERGEVLIEAVDILMIKSKKQ